RTAMTTTTNFCRNTKAASDICEGAAGVPPAETRQNRGNRFSCRHAARITLGVLRPDRSLAKPERGSWKRGARPSRSLCSASRRTVGAAHSAHRLLPQGDCCRRVGETPAAAVETTALPICYYIKRAKWS